MEPKTKTLLLILVSFILGLVGGIVVDRYYFSPSPGHRQSRSGDPKREFAQRLKLDSLQTAQVDSLMTAHRAKMDDVRKLFLASRDSLRIDIRKHLNDEQKKVYDAMMREAESRDSKRREGDKSPPRQ